MVFLIIVLAVAGCIISVAGTILTLLEWNHLSPAYGVSGILLNFLRELNRFLWGKGIHPSFGRKFWGAGLRSNVNLLIQVDLLKTAVLR
jgi:hypothetical protein